MFKRFRIFIINQLGFSIQEANGTIVLLIILFLVIFIPLMVNSTWIEKSSDFTSNDQNLKQWQSEFTLKVKKEPKAPPKIDLPIESFDPNNTEIAQWISMGIAPNIAQRIHSYINAGGHFENGHDLYKIYGIDSSVADQLIPFIKIEETKNFRNNKRTVRNVSDPFTPTAPKPTTIVKKNINLASKEDLKLVYGIGEKLSGRIIGFREALGGFYQLNQLSEVYFLHDSLLPKIEARFYFDTAGLESININIDSLSQIKSHPYINYNQARAIISYREVHGGFDRIGDIKSIKIIPDSTFNKLKPYLSVKE
jgi:competence protein ComEA